MRIVCLCNNWLGLQTLEWLKQRGENIVALIVHPPERSKYGSEILSVMQNDDCLIIPAPELKNPATLQRLGDRRPDIGVSSLFGYVLRKDFIALLPKGCINLHPAFLPYNRGAYPNVWSIVDKTPSGVTIHYIDEGIDTGDIIVQEEVPVSGTDTGASLYQKLETAMLNLFQKTWPAIREGSALRKPQNKNAGTFHRHSDVQRVDEIDLQKSYVAEDLLNAIRARTFPPYPGAFFRMDGKKIYVRLELFEESQIAGGMEIPTGNGTS
jgi:methionyl-tRNA formyltransferase